MTPRVQAAVQDRVICAIKAAHPGTTNTQIAAIAGVNKSQVTHWTDDSPADGREMRLGELVALAAEYGARVVFGPVVAMDGAEIIPARRESVQDPDSALYDVHGPLGSLAAALLESMRDGTRSAEERAAMVPTARQLVRELAEWIAAEESRQAALPMPARRSA